jgi:hypothetical protein
MRDESDVERNRFAPSVSRHGADHRSGARLGGRSVCRKQELLKASRTLTEVKGSHAVYVSQPMAVAAIIAKAANGVALATR